MVSVKYKITFIKRRSLQYFLLICLTVSEEVLSGPRELLDSSIFLLQITYFYLICHTLLELNL